jgi:hypothetical protein
MRARTRAQIDDPDRSSAAAQNARPTWIEPHAKQLDEVAAIGDRYRFDRFAAPAALLQDLQDRYPELLTGCRDQPRGQLIASCRRDGSVGGAHSPCRLGVLDEPDRVLNVDPGSRRELGLITSEGARQCQAQTDAVEGGAHLGHDGRQVPLPGSRERAGPDESASSSRATG